MLAQPSQLIIFLHIVKAAGTSLRWALESNFSTKETLDWYWANGRTLERLEALPAEMKRSLKLFSSHYRFGIHEYFEQEATYMTMLRDPIKRTISEYWHFHTRRQPEDGNYQAHFSNFVHTMVDNHRNNVQTRFIAGTKADEVVTPEHLERAKVNLKTHFSAIGLTERYTESMALYARIFNWKSMPNIQRNARDSRRRSQHASEVTITPELNQGIIEANQLDIALYAFAAEIFEGMLEQYGVTNDVTEDIVASGKFTRAKLNWDRAKRRLRQRRLGLPTQRTNIA